MSGGQKQSESVLGDGDTLSFMLAHECRMRHPPDKGQFCDCDQCVERIVQEAMDYLIRPPVKHSHQQSQGLYKGSTTTSTSYELTGSGIHHRPAERPKTLRRLKMVYDPSTASTASTTTSTTSSSNGAGGGGEGGDALAILSPFDEQEEWARISEIMASFGTGLVRESVFVSELEKEFQERLVMTRSESRGSVGSKDRLTPIGPTSNVGSWLHSLNLSEYESLLVKNGYDHLDFINGVLEDADLREMGIDNDDDCKTIIEAAQLLPKRLPLSSNSMSKIAPDAVDAWLQEIQLQCYQETFRKHLYTDMMRVGRIWEVELTAVLEIHRVGHRRRILASVGAPPAPPNLARSQPQPATTTNSSTTNTTPKLEQLNADLHQLQSNIQQLKEDIRENKMPVSNSGTLRHSHKKNRPAPPPPVQQPPPVSDLEIREPAELLVGVPATLTTQWRHQPEALVQGHITYQAQYLGSTLVKELRGTESTKKSIQKLKKSQKESNKSQTIPDILLAINHRGVRFMNAQTQQLVCEHEIRNIHCACQDADDLTHFAYITKDLSTQTHYCHVFCVQTMDQATEVILTLGQAFEVAYQLALKGQFHQNQQHNQQQIHQRSGNGHVRSHSANLIPNLVTVPITTTTTGSNSNVSQSAQQPVQQQQQHARSHSVNEIKLNGSPLLQLAVNDNLNNALETQPTSGVQQQIGQAPIAVSEEL